MWEPALLTHLVHAMNVPHHPYLTVMSARGMILLAHLVEVGGPELIRISFLIANPEETFPALVILDSFVSEVKG